MSDRVWTSKFYTEYYFDMVKDNYPKGQTEREVNFIEKSNRYILW